MHFSLSVFEQLALIIPSLCKAHLKSEGQHTGQTLYCCAVNLTCEHFRYVLEFEEFTAKERKIMQHVVQDWKMLGRKIDSFSDIVVFMAR